MLLKHRLQDVIVKVSDIHTLLDPYAASVEGRMQWGEEEQDREPIEKSDLCFLSGEPLPECWINSHYRDDEVSRHRCGTTASANGFSHYYGA